MQVYETAQLQASRANFFKDKFSVELGKITAQKSELLYPGT